ncbi:MAG: MoxR family ATPase [Fimbriimonadales bacterium]|nr:MoxR family ATPase [Fimbriimonadales bacterium]
MQVTDVAVKAGRIVEEVEKAIVGKHETVRTAVVALVSNGHLLIEDIPGVGKTTLAKSLALAIGGEFRRIQFTPDLLPSDITGSSVWDQREARFDFRPGPIFGNVILADEINRATPKTQSALLESMEERQVTVDGETRPLPIPFFVIATQNTIEMTGTYPLPEAQLDRFFARISLGYPDRDSEVRILGEQRQAHPLETVRQAIEPTELLDLQQAVRGVFVPESVRAYIVDIVQATRESSRFMMGASPRGSLHLMRAAQAHAALEGHEFVRPDDVKAMAVPVLAHRVIAQPDLGLRGSTVEDAIREALATVPVPVSRSLA